MTRVLFGTTALAAAGLLFGGGQDAAPRSAASAKNVSALDAQVRLDEEAVLASDRPGILAFVEPEEGDRVSSGEQIAKLRDEVAAAALAVAEKTAGSDIEIRYAEKAAAVAETAWKRNVEANEEARRRGSRTDLIPELEIQRLKLDYERASLQIEKAELDREVAVLTAEEKAAELKTYKIISPLEGVVTEVLKHAGEAVQQGDPIVRIVRTDVVRVEGFVSVADAFRVKPGDPVRVRLNGTEIPGLSDELAERTFEGKVSFVDPTAKLVANLVRVWATVPNEENLLRAGLPATMEIVPSGELSTALRPEARR